MNTRKVLLSVLAGMAAAVSNPHPALSDERVAFALPTEALAPEESSRDKGVTGGMEPMNVILGMEKAYSGITDYSATFVKQERVNGKPLPEHTMKLQFSKPFNVYMEWVDDERNECQALFCKNRNEGKVLVRSRILFDNRTLAFDPKGELAMRNNRHSVTDIGIGFLAGMIARNVRKAQANGELKLVDHGEQQVRGRNMRKIESIFPQNGREKYYCHRIIACIDEEHGLPTYAEVYMWDNLLYERYEYRNLSLNPGIDGHVFDSLD